jgi:hypothetical protein
LTLFDGGRTVRIALVLPKRRSWRWHQRLIEHLERRHSVRVFVDDFAPRYPWSLLAWLRAELAIFGERPMTSPDPEGHPDWQELDEANFDLIVNLAERAHPSRKSIAVRYDGALDSVMLLERLLARKTPHLAVSRDATGGLLAQSRLAIDDKTKLSRGLQLAFGRCISLIDRSLERTGEQSEAGQPAEPPPSSRGLATHIGRFLVEKTSRRALRGLRRMDHWSVAIRSGPGPFVPVTDDGKRFYADPFLFAWQGRTFLFVEEFPYATQKGVISAAEVKDGRLVDALVPVLERPYHLSYPLVLADGDAIYMLPETGANNTLELYRAVDFPWTWRLDRVLIEGLPVADATPVFHQGRWWMFAAAAEHGATDHDELFAFYSDRLAGPWRAHRDNPVKSDCRGARPAGRIIQQGRRLLRPAQDCEQGYGTGVVWQEILELTPSCYREREIAYWHGPRDLGVEGVHTFDRIGTLQAIDFKHVIAPWLRRAAELHMAPGAGGAIDRLISMAGTEAGLDGLLVPEEFTAAGAQSPGAVGRLRPEADRGRSRYAVHQG